MCKDNVTTDDYAYRMELVSFIDKISIYAI